MGFFFTFCFAPQTLGDPYTCRPSWILQALLYLSHTHTLIDLLRGGPILLPPIFDVLPRQSPGPSIYADNPVLREPSLSKGTLLPQCLVTSKLHGTFLFISLTPSYLSVSGFPTFLAFVPKQGMAFPGFFLFLHPSPISPGILWSTGSSWLSTFRIETV